MSSLDFPLERAGAGGTAVATEARDDVPSGLRIGVTHDPAEVESVWKRLEPHCPVPFSDYAWVSAWFAAHRGERRMRPVIVTGHDRFDEPLFLLPFACERRGPFTVLVWPGGSHASYQAALFSPHCRDMVSAANATRFWERVMAALPPADAIAAFGLPLEEIDRGNPLAHLPLFDCGSASFRMRLGTDWQDVYESKASAKSRRNDRRSKRRLDEMGTVSFRVADTDTERRRIADALMRQKSQQLRKHGQPDFLSKPQVRSFYEDLVESPHWGDDRCLHLTALEVGEDIVAASLAVTHSGHYHGLILSMADSAAERYGPGRILLLHIAEHLCETGHRYLDFGAGDADYKGGWHDETVHRRAVIVALNRRGRAFVAMLKLFLVAKRRLKNSPALWRLFSRYRRYLRC